MLLQVENLCAGYGEFSVLRNISFGIDEGEMVVLIGPNGAGKSTILKSIVGLTQKTEGRVLFQGKNVTNLPTHTLLEEGIGFVPQGRLVFSSLSVEENLEIGGYLLNHRPTLQKNLEDVYLRFPVLREKRTQAAGSLSGGEQQQLAIGRALMTAPKLLLLDEPSLGLSPKLTHEVFLTLQKIRESGTTLLIVEQNVRLALKYVDRGYLLAAGEIRTQGTVEELGRPGLMQSVFFH